MNQLTATFDLHFSDFHFQASLDVPAEGIIAVFGPSGSGKTTFLRCLAGLERAPTGYMAVGDQIWQDEKQGIFAPLPHRSLGYVFQEPRLFPHLNVKANLEYGWKRISKSQRRIALDQVAQQRVGDIASVFNFSKFVWRRFDSKLVTHPRTERSKTKIGIDIDNGFEPQYTVIKGKNDIIKQLKTEAGDASEVLLATDPDREGRTADVL